MADDNNFLEKIMELGIGISVAQQMPNFLSQCMPNNQQASQTTPPQVPVETAYYLVVDNAQAGPFKENDLLLMIKNDLIKPETLVWKTGMAKWMPASQVPEVNKLFLISKI
jgi:methylmalonyl-CoA mutase N-terminal domain/subunit